MAQWINIFRNNSFINLMRLPLLCRNSRGAALVQPGLRAHWLAGWLAGWLIDEMRANFKFLKFIIHRSNFLYFLLRLTKLQYY